MKPIRLPHGDSEGSESCAGCLAYRLCIGSVRSRLILSVRPTSQVVARMFTAGDMVSIVAWRKRAFHLAARAALAAHAVALAFRLVASIWPNHAVQGMAIIPRAGLAGRLLVLRPHGVSVRHP
jgi:hypothetical protein